MKKSLWLIGIVVALAVGFMSGVSEGAVNGSGPIDTTQADEKKARDTSDDNSAAVHVSFATSITTDGTNLYLADTYSHTIQKVFIASGEVSTFAGLSGVPGDSNGFGSGALFDSPRGITTDGNNLYIADTGNCVIRKIVISTGEVSTLAGTARKCGFADGSGATAQFGTPYGITVTGNSLYVVESESGLIRGIDIPSKVVTTLAVSGKVKGAANGRAEMAEDFKHADAITTDGNNLYIVDNDTKTIRKVVIATGEVTILAGARRRLGSSDGIGPAALFGVCNGIATDGTSLYVADTYNGSIRKIVILTGEVSTLTGTAGAHGFGDGNRAAARFSMVAGIAIDGNNLYVVNNGNNTIRKIVITTGTVTTLADKAAVLGPASAADSTR